MNNQAGATYMTVMLVAIGLIFAGLGINQALITQKKVAVAASSNAAIDTLHEVIYSSMQNQENCWATLGSVLPGGVLTETGSVQTLSVPRIFDSSSNKVAEVLPDGQTDSSRIYVNQSIRIRNIFITLPANFQNLAQMEIEYARFEADHRTKAGYGGKNIKKFIPIVLQRPSGAGGSPTCYAVTAGSNENLIQEFCNDFGGAGASLFEWDPVKNVCKLKNQQCSGQVFVGFKADGTADCKNLEEWADISSLMDTTGSEPCDPATADSVRFEVQANGKVKLICTSGGSSGGGGGGSCVPQPACPAPWTGNMSLTSDSTTHGMSWTYNTSLTEYLHIGSDGDECRLFLRTDTSCAAVNEFRICQYGDNAYTGCAGSAYTSGGGAAPFNIVYTGSTHTKNDCISAGGQLVQVGSAPDKEVCRFDLENCPSGWTQADNWSTTTTKTLTYNQPAAPEVTETCHGRTLTYPAVAGGTYTHTIPGHTWSNQSWEYDDCKPSVFAHLTGSCANAPYAAGFWGPMTTTNHCRKDGTYTHYYYGLNPPNDGGRGRKHGQGKNAADKWSNRTQVGCK